MKFNLIKCPICYGITPIEAQGILALPVNRILVDIFCNQESLKGRDISTNLCRHCNERVIRPDPNGYNLCEQCRTTDVIASRRNLESYLKRLQDAQNKMKMIQEQLGMAKLEAMKEILQRFSKYQIILQEQQKNLLIDLETEASGYTYTYTYNIAYIPYMSNHSRGKTFAVDH